MDLSVDAARRIILQDLPEPPCEEAAIASALGRVLAEDVVSDRDLPPFDRAMMDGYAVRSGDGGPVRVIEEISAGRTPSLEVGEGACSKIMTGAPMPAGADAVQQVEKTRRTGDRVDLLEPVRAGQNVAPVGKDAKAGQVVLPSGHLLRPAEIGILAAVGRIRVNVAVRPRVAVLATGDELVAPDAKPGPGQIRNSNSFGLAAQVRALGLECDDLGTAGDEREAIRERVAEGLTRDVLLVSGGVSAGDRDLVIPALEAAGVTIRMHKVRIKPGKPFCFAPGVFGLPGNPVSAFVIFEVFVRPYLGRLMGADFERTRVTARLRTAIHRKLERVRYLPASMTAAGVEILPWQGSADLFALAKANGFAIVPDGKTYDTGEEVECLVFGD